MQEFGVVALYQLTAEPHGIAISRTVGAHCRVNGDRGRVRRHIIATAQTVAVSSFFIARFLPAAVLRSTAAVVMSKSCFASPQLSCDAARCC